MHGTTQIPSFDPSHPPVEVSHLAVDIVLLAKIKGHLHVLLIKRGSEPMKGSWTLPGGHLDVGERFDHAAVRELEEETGVRGVALTRLDIFDDPERDPRYRNITVGYAAVVDADRVHARAGTDAADARWFPALPVPQLPFDHKDILKKALEWAGFLK